MDPESPGGGMGKPMGIPWFVWIGGAAVLAYFLFFRNSSASTPGTATDTSGDITTGSTTLDKGAVTINVTQGTSEPTPDQDTDKVPWNQNAQNIQADARDALIKQGIKHPTKRQIAEERKDILQTAKQGDAPKGKPKPKRKPKLKMPTRKAAAKK